MVFPAALYLCVPDMQEALKTVYFEQLTKEIKSYPLIGGSYQIESVYLDCWDMRAFDDRVLDTFGTLKNRFPINSRTEVTIGVDIDNVKPQNAISWKKSGINRVSVCVSDLSMVPKIEYAMNCCAYFFKNSTVDIPINSYVPSLLDWIPSFSRINFDGINHVSCYMSEWHQTENMWDLYFAIRDICSAYKVLPYEVFHFARKGYESRYMKALWERKAYIGFGVGAESFDGFSRSKNSTTVRAYIHGISTQGSACETSEVLTEDQIFIEQLMLGIRCSEGIPIDRLIEKKSAAYQREIHERIIHLVNQGYIAYHRGVVHLQPKGYRVERGVIGYLAL